MKGFWDNDVVHKLCAFDLTGEAMAVLGQTSVVVLPTLRYKFHLNSPEEAAKKLKISPAVHSRMVAFVTAETELVDPHDQNERDELTAVSDIDAGEALLVLAAAKEGGSLLCTGDKRFTRALGKSKAVSKYVASLNGRVACLEQVVERIVAKYGLAHVHPRILAEVNVDKTMAAIFSNPSVKLESVRDGLASYIKDVRDRAPFLWTPP